MGEHALAWLPSMCTLLEAGVKASLRGGGERREELSSLKHRPDTTRCQHICRWGPERSPTAGSSQN